MSKSKVFTVTIVEHDADTRPAERFADAQRDFVRRVVKEAIDEYAQGARRENVAHENSKCTFPETGFVRLKDVLKVIPLGKSCWFEGVKSGRFPKPVQLSARCTAWRAADIQGLIESISKQNQK